MKILRENYFYWNQAIPCPLRLRIIYWNQFAWNVAGLAVAVRTQHSSIHHQSVHNWNRLKYSTRIYHNYFFYKYFFISACCWRAQMIEAESKVWKWASVLFLSRYSHVMFKTTNKLVHSIECIIFILVKWLFVFCRKLAQRRDGSGGNVLNRKDNIC